MLSYQKIYSCLQGEHDDWLFQKAREVRLENVGAKIHLRGVIEFSSFCQCNCLYCGLRVQNLSPRYRLTCDEIVATALEAVAMGFETIVLQAGEDPFYSAYDIAQIITAIRKKSSVIITLSLGVHDRSTLELWRKSGANRYLIKLEASQRARHDYFRPSQSFEERMQVLGDLRHLGYEVGSGVIIGLPSFEEDPLGLLAEDIVAVSALGLDMIAVGPFIPHPDTPLKGASPADIELSQRVLALMRICNPSANIPATTALDVLAKMISPDKHASERERALRFGSNVLMEALPLPLKEGRYDIYPNKSRPQSPYDHGMDIIARATRG